MHVQDVKIVYSKIFEKTTPYRQSSFEKNTPTEIRQFGNYNQFKIIFRIFPGIGVKAKFAR